MAQLTVDDLRRILDRIVGRKDEGVRLVYDGASLAARSPDPPFEVIFEAECHGWTTAPWELTAYRASIPAVQAWLSLMDAEQLIDVTPIWGGPEVLVVFTAGQVFHAFPVLECPSASSPPAGAAA
ncbi:hypothetical protein ACWD4N_43000 [Streptomyces sp. NPDC002586]